MATCRWDGVLPDEQFRASLSRRLKKEMVTGINTENHRDGKIKY